MNKYIYIRKPWSILDELKTSSLVNDERGQAKEGGGSQVQGHCSLSI